MSDNSPKYEVSRTSEQIVFNARMQQQGGYYFAAYQPQFIPGTYAVVPCAVRPNGSELSYPAQQHHALQQLQQRHQTLHMTQQNQLQNQQQAQQQQMQVHLPYPLALPPQQSTHQQQQQQQQQHTQPQSQQQQQQQQQQNNTKSKQGQQKNQKDVKQQLPPPAPLSKEQTNSALKIAKFQLSKEESDNKILYHYIDECTIVESSRPLTLDSQPPVKKKAKVKAKEKKKSKVPVSKTPTIQSNGTSQPANQPQVSITPNNKEKNSAIEGSKQTASVGNNTIGTNTSNCLSGESETRKLRAEMYGWTSDQVAKFIESHPDIKEHSSKFLDFDFDGKALLILIDKTLNLETLTNTLKFKPGPAIKIVDTLTKYKLDE